MAQDVLFGSFKNIIEIIVEPFEPFLDLSIENHPPWVIRHSIANRGDEVIGTVVLVVEAVGGHKSPTFADAGAE